jgi:hypothetical protein
MNSPTPVPENDGPKEFLDYIDVKYREIVRHMMGERHGRAGVAGLMAARMWTRIAESWVTGSLEISAQEVIRRQLLETELADIEQCVGRALDDVGLTDSAANDLRAIQEAFKQTVMTYNADATENKEASTSALRQAASKMPLPFLRKLLDKPGTVAFVSGEDDAVSEFLHMGVGFMLLHYIPVNVLADGGDFVSGLRRYKAEHDVPYLNFIDKWASAGKDVNFMRSMIGNLPVRGLMVCRDPGALFGVDDASAISMSLLHNVGSACRREGVSMLIGASGKAAPPKARKMLYVSVEKRMEATDPENPMMLHPVHYVDGKRCVFPMETEHGGAGSAGTGEAQGA